MMECWLCKKPLDNGLDTFGDTGKEMCWECWSTLEFVDKDTEPMIVITADIWCSDVEEVKS